MSTEMITCLDENKLAAGEAKRYFLDKDAAGFYEWFDWSAEKGLERLVFRVSKSPKYLQGHLERIYYCFQNGLDDALFGALIDLFIVLKQEGKALGQRMLAGTQSRLIPGQVQSLVGMLRNTVSVRDVLPISRYSVFSRGLLSDRAMITLSEQGKLTEKDPLALAKDYVDYGLLDEATEVLEQALLETTERLDLHEPLLLLYKVNRNEPGYKRMYQLLKRKKINLPTSWEDVEQHFSQFKSK